MLVVAEVNVGEVAPEARKSGKAQNGWGGAGGLRVAPYDVTVP